MRRWILLCTFCICCLCMAVLPCRAAEPTPPAIPAEGDVWDGETITEPSKLVQKDGVYYYEISTCAELAYVAQTSGEWLSKNYILANDLILNDVELTWDKDGNLLNDPETLNEWTPIGSNYSSSYTGTFDGGGHTVSGVYINQPGMDSIGFFGYASRGTIHDLTVINSDIRGNRSVGGIVGDADSSSVSGCMSYGAVTGSGNYGNWVGGIAGSSNSSVRGCVNYGTVTGGNNGFVGGIAGNCYGASGCVNYGAVTGSEDVGGIVGCGYASGCMNYGAVTGSGDSVGGIVGYNTSYSVCGCVNCGTVTGSEDVGGICGYFSYLYGSIDNCYNTAEVIGTSNTGGIVGYGDKATIKNCYNIGSVVRASGAANTFGAIIGSDGALWGKDTITGCYYLKSDEVDPDLYGCGNIASSGVPEPDGFYPKTADELKVRETFVDWAFETTYNQWGYVTQEQVWSISPDLNSGYPYLAWQDVSDVPLTGLTLSNDTLSLSVGDGAYLTASQSPATAALPDLTWSSSEETVATVNANGRVAAVGAGDAEITVSGGGFSANCTVTVKARQQSEYRIGTLSLRDANGVEMTEIPTGSFLVTIPITKVLETGNATVALAVYAANGQYRGLLYVSVEDIPVGATVKITLPVDNTNGDIAQLKAFTFASFDMLIPLGEASVFPS